MRKFNTRNIKPVNVMRFGASHVGRNCGGGEDGEEQLINVSFIIIISSEH